MAASTSSITAVASEKNTNKISTKGFLFSLDSSVYFCAGGSWAQSTYKSGLFVWEEPAKKLKVVSSLATDSHYPDLNQGVAHGQLGECVYAFGGQTPIGKLTNELWKGEVSDNHVKWTILQTTGDTPSPRLYATLCELTADKLILVGGSYYPHITTSLYWDMKMCSADVYIFEVTTCQWSKVTCDSPQLVRMHHCAIPIEDNVCIAGGAFLTESGILQPNQDIVEIWQEDGKVGFHTVGKLSLWSMGHLLLNEQIYFIGGYTSEKVLSENIHIMDPGTYTVSKGGDGPKGLVKACKFPKKNSGLLLVESSGKADIMVLNGQEENEGDIQEMDNQEQEEEEENEGEEDGEESDDEDDEDEQEESDAEDEQEEEDEDDDQSGEPIRPTDFACDPCKIREGREGIYEPIQDFALIEIGKEAFATCQKCKRNFHLYCQGERRVPKNLNELYFYCKNSCRTKRTGFTNQLQ